MNKVLFALIFSVTFFDTITYGQAPVFVGVKAGLSIPNLTSGESKNDWNKDYKSRVGPQFGIFANIPIGKHWSIVPGLDFAGQGGKRNNRQPMTIPEQYLSVFQNTFNSDKDYLFGNLNNTSRLNFLQIPVQIQYHTAIGRNDKLEFFAQFGPFVGYMLAAKQLIHSDSLRVFLRDSDTSEIPQFLVQEFFGSSIDTVIDGKKELYHWNYGIQGSIGFNYIIGKGKLSIEGGGNYGLRYLQRGDAHGKNRIGAGLVVVGYALPLNFGKHRSL